MDVQTATRIVILGKTGNGKSSLGNTILQDKFFPISHSSNTKSNYCTETKSVNGKPITLIETPSFFDTCDSEEEFKVALVKSITDCAPGPHAFLIVLKVERYTVHEQEIIHQIHKYFSDEAFRFAVVVFTHGDQLPEGQTIKQFVAQNVALNGLVQKCGGRCHVVDNKYWKNTTADQYRDNQVQVALLLNTVDTIIKGNNNGYYTNEMFQEVMEALEEEENDIRNKESSELSPAAIRERARSNVSERWVTILVGTTTGVLMGAFLGVVNSVRSALLNTQSLSGIVSKATLLSAAQGGITGGMRGYEASIEATSPQEAMERVWDVHTNQTAPGQQ